MAGKGKRWRHMEWRRIALTDGADGVTMPQHQKKEGMSMAKENKVNGYLIERRGKYYAVVSYYVGDERKLMTKSTGIPVNAHRKREAERKKDEMVRRKEEELERQKIRKGQHPFAECLERWLDAKAEQVEETTAWGYRTLGKTIIEYFRERDTMIEELTTKDLNAYYEWALENGRRRVYREGAPTGLSRRTVRDHASLIRAFLNEAVVQEVIATNPADKATVPRVRKVNTDEIAFMDDEQANEFLDYVRGVPMFEKLYLFSKLGFCYGLRRSELLGLKWSAIDFGRNEVVINHTVVRGENGAICRDNVKTKSSYRCLPLMEYVKGDLLDRREAQKRAGTYSEDGYVFIWEDGRRYDPDYMSKLFRKAVLRCGKVPQDVTVHGLRHSCCAILFEKGWNLGEVQNWLGHSDISITANIYNHVSMKWKNKQGKKADEIFKDWN